MSLGFSARNSLLLVAIPITIAVLIGRNSPPHHTAERARAITVDPGPESVLIKTGSVEARLRAMEAQLLELRVEVARIKSEKGDR